MEVIKNVKKQIELTKDGLPEKTLADGRVSRVTIVPFYDRTQLIGETLGTLRTALTEEIMVTIIVVIIMVMNLRSSLLISLLLPLAVLITFVAMKVTGVDANIMSLSGIAIATGFTSTRSTWDASRAQRRPCTPVPAHRSRHTSPGLGASSARRN